MIKYLIKGVCLATILLSPHQALAYVLCATDYANYRTMLLKNGWTPVSVANNISEQSYSGSSHSSYVEVVTGTKIASARWLNPKKNKQVSFVLWWQPNLCVSPQFEIE